MAGLGEDGIEDCRQLGLVVGGNLADGAADGGLARRVGDRQLVGGLVGGHLVNQAEALGQQGR